jgi:hypothetical protein
MKQQCQIIVALCALLLPAELARADLGAALRRARGAAAVSAPSSPSQSPIASSVVVPLKRVSARLSEAEDVASFYVGSVTVGTPAQELQVLFDTSSGHVLLPHRACQSKACVEHRRYSPWESSSATDVNVDGEPVVKENRLAKGTVMRQVASTEFTQADLGEGKATGVLVRDEICLGSRDGPACASVAMVAATKLEDVPFRAMPHDGIIGLGLDGLSAGPLCSFLDQLFSGSKDMLPQIGIYFGTDAGELYIGSHDRAMIAEPLRWFPVSHPENGYWQVEVLAVRAGNITVDDCKGGCHGLVDTGASRIGVQEARMAKLQQALASTQLPAGGCQGPTLEFDLGGMVLTLQPSDYANDACTPQLSPLDLDEPKFAGLYALGERVLRRYYAAFDWEAKRVGFAPSAEPLAPWGGASAPASASTGAAAGTAGSSASTETVFAF